VRHLEEIAQELDNIQEQLCELYSKRRSLEKEYQSAVLRKGLTNQLDSLSVQS
jgi:flagellar biosynthesis chaperone FliJ